MVDFSERLKNLRKNKNLTQAQLADKTGISASMIGMYEQGSRKASIENLELLCDFFNVDTDYILGRSNVTMRFLDSNQLNKIDSEKDTYGDHQANLDHFSNKPDLLEIYNEIYENESLQLLFDSAKNLTPQDLEMVLTIIKGIKKERGLD